MRTILTSISLLLFSILLVISCEVLDKSLQNEQQLETKSVLKTIDSEEMLYHQVNVEFSDLEVKDIETHPSQKDSVLLSQ